MSTAATPQQGPFWGYLAILLGAAALAMAMLVIFAGPFAPQQTVGVTIGEIAGDIVSAARRSVQGIEQPPPDPRGWDIDRVLMILTPLLGVIAVVLAVLAAVRREPWRLATYGAALGGAAITVQFIWWVALLICGIVLLVSIIENLGGILDGFGG